MGWSSTINTRMGALRELMRASDTRLVMATSPSLPGGTGGSAASVDAVGPGEGADERHARGDGDCNQDRGRRDQRHEPLHGAPFPLVFPDGSYSGAEL